MPLGSGQKRSRPPLLVLLGAGASIPFVSGVRDLTDRLLAWDKYRAPGIGDGDLVSPSDRWNTTAAPLLTRGPSDTRPPFFKALRGIVASAYSDNGAALTFEHLIHACDELAHVLPDDPDRYDRSRWMLQPFFEVRQKYAAWVGPRVPRMMSFVAEEARYFILEHVAQECEALTNPTPVSDGLGKLADRFLLRSHSLNYDDLALAAGVSFYTGFDENTGEFRPEYPWPTDIHTFAQLHGSVRWGLVDSQILACECIDKARANWESGFNQQVVQDGHALPRVPMITGFRKPDLLLERPFGTYLHVFHEQLLATPRWLIIGYGFGDPHVNRALQQAWASWGLRDHPARAVVVDFLTADGRNTVAPGAEDRRGWAKLQALLARVFRRELDPWWHLRNARPFPGAGLVRFPTDRLAVNFDGVGAAMTTGLTDIERFLTDAVIS
jgi:hypothetical protein